MTQVIEQTEDMVETPRRRAGVTGVARSERTRQKRPAASTKRAKSASTPPARGTTQAPERKELTKILQIEVPIIVRLAAKRIPLADILTLKPGAIIEFEKRADSGLDLMINNRCIGQGQAVKLGEHFALRVTEIGSMDETIKAMGR